MDKTVQIRPALSAQDRERKAARKKQASVKRTPSLDITAPKQAPSVTPEATKTTVIEAAPAPAAKLRAAGYCRVSTGSDLQRTSITAQRQHYEDYIRSNPEWIFSGIYWEAGVTGTKTESRPELQRLIADCRAHRIDLVLTKLISRFSRDTSDCLEMVRTLTSLGVGIIFQKENIDTRSMDSEFLLTLFSSIAEEESQSISSNSKWAVQKRFQNGTFKYSKAPYGYDLVNGNFVVNPEQAPIVKEIFRRALSGEGTIAIARDLNERGIPTGTKRRDGSDGIWNSSMILGMIKNVTYTGDVLMQKTYSGRDYRRRKNTGERAQYYADAHHEGIIDHETFERAGASLKLRRKGAPPADSADVRRKNPTQNRYAFSGKLVCGCCGVRMKRITGRAGGGKRHFWGCSAHTADLQACSMKREQEESLRNAFITMLNRLAFLPLADLYIEMLTKEEADKSGPEATALRARQKSITEEKERLTLLLSKGCGEPVLFQERIASLNAEETALQKEMEKISGESTRMRETKNLKRLIGAWKTGRETDAERIFTEIAEHATVNTGEAVTFHLKCGLKLTETQTDNGDE